MRTKTPLWVLKILGISSGVAISLIMLEILARLLPASNEFPLQFPLTCPAPNDSKSININCIFRRHPRADGIYTSGKLPPLPIFAEKRTNDIGQFSNADFEELLSSDGNTIKLLSIGDSFVEALQVPNESSFHGLLNGANAGNGKIIVSTSIGRGGNSFPQHLISTMYAKNRVELKDIVLIYPIISNDFEESFLGNDSNYLGGYFINSSGDKRHGQIGFNDYRSSARVRIKRAFFEHSAILRYLFLNLNISRAFNDYPLCIISSNPCNHQTVYRANIMESTATSDPKRYRLGEQATELFLSKLLVLRPSRKERQQTLFVIDADRHPIYHASIPENSYFKHQRDYFIRQARKHGFGVIDMKDVFYNHYNLNGQKFEFVNDSHWNSLAHSLVTREILHKLQNILAISAPLK